MTVRLRSPPEDRRWALDQWGVPHFVVLAGEGLPPGWRWRDRGCSDDEHRARPEAA